MTSANRRTTAQRSIERASATAHAVDGTIAYRELRSTSDPYDPKLNRIAIGTASVEPPQQVDKAEREKTGATEKPVEREPAHQL